MNGIIHNCSHPNDNDASFRITEEAIFLAVFAYISHLFSVIKPKKLFFLAVDGVAPRAKMNQQRSRRFKTAKEMKEVVEKAKKKGEIIPEGEGFDSNCITPGELILVPSALSAALRLRMSPLSHAAGRLTRATHAPQGRPSWPGFTHNSSISSRRR